MEKKNKPGSKFKPKAEPETINIWPGCDASLAVAITEFSKKWKAYSPESRSHSIFRLMRELIDPAWNDLQMRFPSLDSIAMDRAWRKYQPAALKITRVVNDNLNLPILNASPCAAKINGQYVLSAFALHYGFPALEEFFRLVAREMYGPDHIKPPHVSFDCLRVLAQACRNKKSKKKMWDDGDEGGSINIRRADRRPVCRFCGEKTEIIAYCDGAVWSKNKSNNFGLSRLYCSAHRPKAPGSELVRANYFKAKRSESKFDLELGRLERQVIGARQMPWARSGDELVDRYILRFVEHHLYGLLDSDSKLRDEARKMVDQKITDRKKKIVMLLASGLNQSQAAQSLGITRQTVSKDLQSITDAYKSMYRLDLLPDPPADLDLADESTYVWGTEFTLE